MRRASLVKRVTRVYPFLSEVTLLVDREQAIPVLNTPNRGAWRSLWRPGSQPRRGYGCVLWLLMPMYEDDLLSTSGLDGVYPPGLPVAKVIRVERRADSAFARIYCKPLAKVEGRAMSS